MSASNPSQNDGCLEEPRGYYCSICYHGYKRDGQYVPRNLNCGHTFCTECLKKLSVVQRAGIITCPTCKAATVLGFANDTRKLPKNYALLEILEGLEEAAVSAGKGASLVPPPSSQASEDEETSLQNNPELFCQSHEKEPKKVYCITDKQKICIYCQVYGSHQGHECQLLSVVADEKRKNVSSLAETLSKQHDRFCEKRKQLSNAGYAIRFREEKLMREVTRHFEMLRKKLYRRELHLKSLIKNKTNGKMEVLEGKRKKCSEFIVTIEAARSSCQSVQSLSDHEVLEVKEVLQEKVRKLTDDANSYSVQATVEDDLFCQLDLTLSDTIMQYGVVGEDSGKAAALYNGSSSSGDSTEGASGGSSTSSSSTPETSSTEESNHDVNRYQLPTRTNKSVNTRSTEENDDLIFENDPIDIIEQQTQPANVISHKGKNNQDIGIVFENGLVRNQITHWPRHFRSSSSGRNKAQNKPTNKPSQRQNENGATEETSLRAVQPESANTAVGNTKTKKDVLPVNNSSNQSTNREVDDVHLYNDSVVTIDSTSDSSDLSCLSDLEMDIPSFRSDLHDSGQHPFTVYTDELADTEEWSDGADGNSKFVGSASSSPQVSRHVTHLRDPWEINPLAHSPNRSPCGSPSRSSTLDTSPVRCSVLNCSNSAQIGFRCRTCSRAFCLGCARNNVSARRCYKRPRGHSFIKIYDTQSTNNAHGSSAIVGDIQLVSADGAHPPGARINYVPVLRCENAAEKSWKCAQCGSFNVIGANKKRDSCYKCRTQRTV